MPAPSAGHPAPAALLVWWGTPLFHEELLWWCMLAFWVLCHPPTPLSSPLLYPGAPCAFGNELLCFRLEEQPHGDEAGIIPLFWPEYYLVYFRRGCCLPLCKRLFLESTWSQTCSTRSHVTRGKPFINFICFFPWESSPNA